MPKSKKSKRRYVPNRIGTKDTISTLFEGDEPLKGELKDKVLLTVHMAARSLSMGDAIQDDWGALVSAMNISLILCERAGNKEIGLKAIYDASNALISVQERFFEKGRRVATGAELTAINGGIHVFEEMVETVSKRQYVWASDQIEKRLREGRSVGVTPNTRTQRYELRAA
jgi:hypothetical protein